MRTINSRGISWLVIVSIMIVATPMFMLADEAAPNIEKIKQLRQLQNQGTLLKNIKANSVATRATPEQERMLRLSKALTKIQRQASPIVDPQRDINLVRDNRPTPQVPTHALRDVFYNSGIMSSHPDSLFFNFLTGENGSDTTGMDVRITGNEGTNFGNENAAWSDPSLLYFFDPSYNLDYIDMVHTIDDPMQAWTTVSWDNAPAGNDYQPLAVGNIWVVYTRTSHMYVAFEVTNVNTWGQYFEFDYMIQSDGTNLFDGTHFNMTVNGDVMANLEIGSNPYFEITLSGHLGGEFAVIWDGNHNGDLDDGDVGLEYYEFMDNDMNDADGTDGIYGFTYTDEMADGLNYLADDLLFVASADMDMAVTPVSFYTVASPLSVSGSIYETDGGGAPLEGIVVWAVYENDENDNPSVIVVTDGAGQYHIDLPDTGNVMVGTEDHFYMTEGLMPDPSHHFVNVQGAETGYNFYYVAPNSAIEGLVLDEMGTPVVGVEVTAHMGDGPGYQAITDGSGFYSMGVMAGDYDVELNWETLSGSFMIPQSQYVSVGDFAVATVDFTLIATDNVISGTVMLDNAPLADAFVVGMSMNMGVGYSVTVSGADGSYDLPVFGGPNFLYNLMVFFPDNMENVVQISENWDVPAGAVGEDIVLETLTGGLFGYFMNSETGEPIMDSDQVGLSMYNIDTGMEFHRGPGYDGYYEAYVPPGTYEVMAGGWNWMSTQVDTFTITDFLIEHDIYLTPITYDASLEGFVYDSDGMPVPYAQVQIGNDGWGNGMQTDEFGYFYFDLPVGYYFIGAWAPGYYDDYDEISIGPGMNTFNFFLEAYQVDGAITGMVHEEMTGAPIEDANVYAYSWDDNESYWSFTDGDGIFWFDLPNGTYDVVVEHWDYPPMWIDGVTVQNDTTFLDFAMAVPDGGVEGYVRDGDGYPIYDAQVMIVNLMDSTGFWGWTDEDGYYSIPAFSGEYHISAWADGFEPSQPSAFTINNDWQSIDIWLEQRQFATPPQINYIVDQPFDQGRWVRMQFWPGGTEWGPFSGYSIWRLSNTPWGPILDFVEYLPNHDMEMYNVVLPTLVDSSAMVSDPIDFLTGFMVTGHWDTYGYIDGEPGAGYSVDNIHPGIPGPLTLLGASDESVELGWEMSDADDFQYFEVYRAINPDFTDANVYATIEPMFTDGDVTIGQTYYYAVSAVDANGNMSDPTNVITTSIVSVDDAEMIPTAYGLSQNYPNPFNPTTSIEFALPEASEVSLEIYNLLGQKVRTLVNGYVPAGYINTSWDGMDQNGKEISSGTYIYRLQTADQTFSKKMVLMK
ncbi:MAG: carboxypeptidase regulatory-like domain-containing protein [Candidatus Marinimicrobia bacterium]|nr:carboxypeptidase regulatory-like domain-containing protein [Candidatus Neomarinimicrobiota bacterium]